jgi:hypothetical protein
MSSYAAFERADQRASLLQGVAIAAREASGALGGPDAQKIADGVMEAANLATAQGDAARTAYDRWRARMRPVGWALFAVAALACLLLGAFLSGPAAAWEFLGEIVFAVVALVGIGLAVQGKVLGAAIDTRNRVSLSKLQMLAWTVLAVGALTSLGGAWLHVKGVSAALDPPPASVVVAAVVVPATVAPAPSAPASNALAAPALTNSPAVPAPTNAMAAAPSNTGSPTNAIAGAAPVATATSTPASPDLIPAELLLAMGIAATSFVASPLLLSLKSGEEPTDQDKSDLAAARGTSLANLGKVDGRNDPAEASFADIFHGDEVGNATDVDLGKVQQIFITVLLLGLYGASIFKALDDAHGLIRNLPPMNRDFVELLAISHASYLGYKAAPKTATAPP